MCYRGILSHFILVVTLLGTFAYSFISHSNSRIMSRLMKLSMDYGDRRSSEYLARMVQRKKAEVDNLLRRHNTIEDPLIMRMTYVNTDCKYEVAKGLKKPDFGKEELGKMSVIVDVKRKSPTVPMRREVVDYTNAGEFCQLLSKINVDGMLLNTEMEYGGKFHELKESKEALQRLRLPNTPPLIHKDLIIHPIQIAQSLENGAAGVLIIMAAVGKDLESLLDSCTVMGTEALVEIHSPAELEFALERGATMFLINMWDRISGQLYRDQAKYMASMIPRNCVAIVGGDIRSMRQVIELGSVGYDGVVLGRNIVDLPDIKTFVDQVHEYVGPPRAMGMGMKSSSWAASGGLQ